jgi:benzoate/toluate 1,2-dioxygenase alpha subunit
MPGVISSGRKNEDEGLYPVQHGYWLTAMEAALQAEEAAEAHANGKAGN